MITMVSKEGIVMEKIAFQTDCWLNSFSYLPL